MSGFREENIRVRIQSISDLPTVGDQLSELNRLTGLLIESNKQSALSARTNALQQVEAIGGVTQALKEQQSQQKKASDENADGLKKVNAQYDDLGKQVRNFTTLVASAFTLNEFKQFGMDVIDAKTKIDSLKIALDTMIGSKRESAELYAQMVQMAKATPFTLEDISENVVKLKAYNIATQDLIPTMTALGNIAAAVGQEKLPQLTLAYGQVMNFGRLMGTELRQFTEAGVPLFDLLATSMGKTRDEVIKLTQDHKIMAADVTKAIMQASQEGGKYYNLMAQQAKTVGGEVSNLADKFYIAKGKIGDFFEDDIRKGTKYLADLTDELTGSDAAIRRTTEVVGAAGTAMATYTLATKAQAAASAAWTVIVEGAKLAMGTYNATMILLKGTTEGFTEAQIASATAARGTWAALASNPIGAIVAVVGLATSAYLAWKAASEDVTQSMTEEGVALQKEQVELSALVHSAMAAADGTQQRKDAIALLVSKYPEYFGGLSTEKTTNLQLKGILDSVNLSYQDRIALAREAYKVEAAKDRYKEVFDLESELFERVKKTNALNEEVVQSFGGSAKKLLEYMQANGQAAMALNSTWSGFYRDTIGQMARNVVKEQTDIETTIVSSTTRINNFNQGAAKTAIDIENQRHKTVMAQLKDGSKEEEAEIEKHNTALAKLNGTYREQESSASDAFDKEKKAKAKLTAAEVQAIIKQADDDTLKSRLAYLDALEKADIEAANKAAKNAEDAEKRIQAIHEQYENARKIAIEIAGDQLSESIQKEIDQFDARNNKQRDYITSTTTGFKQIAQEAEKRANAEVRYEKQVQEERQKTTDLMAQAAEVEEKTQRKIINLISEFAGQASPLLGSIAKGLLNVIENTDQLSGHSMQVAQDSLAQAQAHASALKAIYEAGMGGTAKQVEEAEQAVAKSQMNLANVRVETASTVFGVMGAIKSVLDSVASAFNEAQAATYKAIAEGLQKTKDAYQDLYETVHQSSEDFHKKEMESFNGSLDEKLAKIDAYYEREKTYAIGADRLQAQLTYYSQIADVMSKSGASAKELIEGIERAEANKTQASYELEIAEAKFKIEKAEEVRDAKLKAIDDELSAFKTAKQAEIDAENQALAAREAATEQFYSDKQLRLQEDDNYRATLLQQGEAREVKALQDAEARELQRAEESKASAEEVADIKNAFEKLIAQKHAEYADAKGQKEKEVSLANQEAAAQEADTKQGLEVDTANAVQNIMKQIADQEAKAAQDRLNANAEYARQVLQANVQMFNAQKAMKIAELRAEIAVLEGQKGLFSNNGAINTAIDAINNAIGQIVGLTYDTGGVNVGSIHSMFGTISIAKQPVTSPWGGTVGGGGGAGGGTPTPTRPVDAKGFPVSEAYDEKGNVITLTYDPSGHSFTAFNKEGQQMTIRYATGFAAATGRQYFVGTEFVDGLGYPSGRDTVPAWLTAGERVMTVEQNQALGDISNEELVKKITYFDRLASAYPQLFGASMWSELAGARLTLPAGVMSADGRGSLDLSGLRQDLAGVRSAIENQKLLSVTMDERGFTKSLIGTQSRTNYYQKLLNR